MNGSRPNELNYIVPVSNGLLRKPHIKKIGSAWSLFLKFEDMVTSGEGTDGFVLGGKVITDALLAGKLGTHEKTVAVNRRRLEEGEYIATRQTGKGYAVTVKKSKKWLLLQSLRGSESTPSENDEGAKSLHQKERPRSIRGFSTY